MKTKVMQIHQHGGPEVLSWDDVDLPSPGPGEALIRHTAIGFNFVDTYHRSGQLGHKVSFPLVLGSQGAGMVEAIGADVEGLKIGDRVTYANLLGAYAEARIVPTNRMIKTPDDISDDLAAAAFLRTLTAHYLLTRLYPVQPGETILVHAAAGGTGLILCQWAKALGAVVIGTVSTDAKAEIARAAGCSHPIVYTREHFVDEVMEITKNEGVPVVYDSVGHDTFMGSLDCLKPMGMGINFGTASGQVEPFPMQHLHKKSLIVTRPTLATYIAKREDYEVASEEVFRVLRDGTVKVDITRRFALKDAAQAHQAIESRETTGTMILVP
ncbi:MAG: quinone oxidoreductase [Rhodospirillales bacterium]|nr:quinone oxidoreductase [Rhodospirillales bacterium]